MPDAAEAEKGRKLMMTGAMLVMGAMMVGGLGGVALAVVGQRLIGGVLGAAGGIAILVGFWLQLKGFRLFSRANQK